jgi:hypothetical protein
MNFFWVGRPLVAAATLLLAASTAFGQPTPASPPPASFLFAGPMLERQAGGTVVYFEYVVAFYKLVPTKVEILDADTGRALLVDDAPQLRQPRLVSPKVAPAELREWSGRTPAEPLTDRSPAWLFDGRDTRINLELRVYGADQAQPISSTQPALYSRQAKAALIQTSGELARVASSKAEQPKAQDAVTLLSRDWKVGHRAGNEQQQVVEYVLPGDSVRSWQELLTRQSVTDPESRISIGRLLDAMRRGFTSDCKDFSWTVVSQTDARATVAWSHTGCDRYPAQAERFVISRVSSGLCKWAYATKSPPLKAAIEAQLDDELAKLPCS